jgi:hypothetical protein
MSDYRFQVVEHNGIPCLHVMIDHVEIDENGEEIIHTHIPLDDILEAAVAQGSLHFLSHDTTAFEISPLTGQVIRQIPDEEEAH